MFRLHGFPPSWRLAPPDGSRACCIPQPIVGFTGLRPPEPTHACVDRGLSLRCPALQSLTTARAVPASPQAWAPSPFASLAGGSTSGRCSLAAAPDVDRLAAGHDEKLSWASLLGDPACADADEPRWLERPTGRESGGSPCRCETSDATRGAPRACPPLRCRCDEASPPTPRRDPAGPRPRAWRVGAHVGCRLSSPFPAASWVRRALAWGGFPPVRPGSRGARGRRRDRRGIGPRNQVALARGPRDLVGRVVVPVSGPHRHEAGRWRRRSPG